MLYYENFNLEAFSEFLISDFGQHCRDAGSIDHLINGKLILGADGEFLQIVLKKSVTKDDVHERLKDVFQNNEVDVWLAELM